MQMIFRAIGRFRRDKSGNIAKGDQNWPLVPKLANP